MALKDWKKVGKYHWLNLHFNRDLEILEFYGWKSGTEQYKYKVYVEQNHKTLHTHPFETKQAALKFAKSYMRKH